MSDEIEQELLEFVETKKEPVAVEKPFTGDSTYTGTKSVTFRSFTLRPEIERAIQDCGFEHPSTVQQECIPQALLGTDIICQGKSGMGKTAIFVITVLQLLDPIEGELSCIVIEPTRELAYQVCKEFNRFSKHIPDVETVVVYGGIPFQNSLTVIRDKKPNILVATPGRLLELINKRAIDLSKVRFFIIDEADQVFEKQGMSHDVEKIIKKVPKEKQTMLFSATMPEEVKDICRKFTNNATEVFVDGQKNLTLHGIQQYYIKLNQNEKNRRLINIFDNYAYNQIVIFVSTVQRARALNELLNEAEIPSIAIHGSMSQQDRLKNYEQFKNFDKRILIATELFARGIDIERVNIVINYDMPIESDTYLHRVGRAGRFGTKGLAISFIASDDDQKMLDQIQARFEVKIEPLPASIDKSTYMNS